MTSKRIDFKRSISRSLFNKSGGNCSVPRCKNPTVAPSKGNSKAINLGTACHIYSAAPNGPRGRGGKSEEFIGSEENGIWCCAYHGALIDKNDGRDYSAEELFSWKQLCEARVIKKTNDAPSPLGWVESIEFSRFLGASKLPKVSLSRNTLVIGGNGSGKSSLMQFAASVSNSKYAERFVGNSRKSNDSITFQASVKYSTVDHFSKEVRVDVVEGRVVKYESSIPCLLSPGDLEVIYCSEVDLEIKDHEDHMDFFMRFLNVDRSALYALSKSGPTSIMPGEIKFEKGREYDEDGEFTNWQLKSDGSDYMEIYFKHSIMSDFISYSALSSSEKVILLIDMAIIKAREISKQRLTLVLMDSLIGKLDKNNFEKLLNALSNSDFQSAVVIPPYMIDTVLFQNHKNEKYLKELDYLKEWRLRDIEDF